MRPCYDSARNLMNQQRQPGSWNVGVRGAQVRPLIELDATTIRVEAGPGTGKTFGLVRRVERILHPDGLNVAGREVLVVAFNRVIAKQLRTDITARLTTFEHNGDPMIRTVHALCVDVIGEELRLLLPHEREAMIYDLLEEFPALRAAYQRANRTEKALSEHEAGHEDHIALWDAARHWLERHHAGLISDLPSLLLDRLQLGDFPDQAYSHIIVDEFQDLTPAEQHLMFRLRRPGAQLVALGDPRQSIYRFRGNEPLGLQNLEQLAGGQVRDVVMRECQRCPEPIVIAANRLMALAEAEAMIAVSPTAANLHVVTWPTPRAEADGMAHSIVENVAAHPDDRHLVMVTRRDFGYWLREKTAELNPDLRVELSFSESLLETWAVREAFLLFCLLVDPDPATWRAWFAYQRAETGEGFKAASRNAGAYLPLLTSAEDHITAEIVEAFAEEPRERQRGQGGTVLWDRARRFLDLRNAFVWPEELDAADALADIFHAELWIPAEYTYKAETARLDLALLLKRASTILAEHVERVPAASRAERVKAVAQRLRYYIATNEPFEEEGHAPLQVATLWGAKGVTADHVYMLGVCGEAIPGQRREDYPGTDAEFRSEQQRLFYVSITRSTRTLVISRALGIRRGEAQQLGLSVGAAGGPFWAVLSISPFLRQIVPVLPDAVAGEEWNGCA
jgi:DNA helicase-2/ATP-dependent DNA helicase PcrA